MKPKFLFAALAAAAMVLTLPAAAPVEPAAKPDSTTLLARPAVPPPAAPRARVSPHETISLKVDDNRVTVVYGRPYSKDPKTGAPRKIWGALVPAGKVWRTGADEATLFVTQRGIVLGGVPVPAGAYTLYTLPAADGSAKLLLNRSVGQWGADPYDEKQEFARVELRRADLSSPVDEFTMALEKSPDGGAVLKMAWENTQYSAAYAVSK
ncbi:MAG: hypothetical protein JWM88_2969 [Verrucomicrobia bacterium]|nr:hypothetical protein [Verrucomicrobiota bacterium]